MLTIGRDTLLSTHKFDLHLYLHFAHLLEERLRTRLAPFGIHSRQARILGLLGIMGQASQAKLARELGCTAASMSTMTSRLLEADLIKRDVDRKDQRSNVLRLTRFGNSLLKQIHQEWQAIDQECTDVIGEKNIAKFAESTLQLRNAFGGSTPGEESSNNDTEASSES